MGTPPIPRRELVRAVRAMKRADGNQMKAATALGWALPTLRYRLNVAVREGIIKAIPAAKPKEAIAEDWDKLTAKESRADLRGKYDEALRTIAAQRRALLASHALAAADDSLAITPIHGTGTSEGTVVALASDWHVEERVGPEVGGLNVYNLEIAESRAIQYWQGVVRITRLFQHDIKVPHLVLGLLGDFITGDIHEELRESCQLRPTEAIVFAQRLITAGLEFVLNHTNVTITAMCHSGNHARTTEKVFISQEQGHSLEYLMYRHLATRFRGEKRIRFQIPPSYHSYLPIYDEVACFHHGHMVKFQGGVGGLTVPMNKAIDRWNEARPATIYFNGHWHTAFDGERFVSNASLIGHSAYAISVKAPYGKPTQSMTLIDKRRGRTGRWRLFFDDTKARKRAA